MGALGDILFPDDDLEPSRRQPTPPAPEGVGLSGLSTQATGDDLGGLDITDLGGLENREVSPYQESDDFVSSILSARDPIPFTLDDPRVVSSMVRRQGKRPPKILTEQEAASEAARLDAGALELLGDEQLSAKSLAKKTPFVGIGFELADELGPLAYDLLREGLGSLSDEEREQMQARLVKKLNAEAVRAAQVARLGFGQKAGYYLGTVAANIPTYVAEFFLTAGTATAGRVATGRALAAAMPEVRRSIANQMLEEATKRLVAGGLAKETAKKFAIAETTRDARKLFTRLTEDAGEKAATRRILGWLGEKVPQAALIGAAHTPVNFAERITPSYGEVEQDPVTGELKYKIPTTVQELAVHAGKAFGSGFMEAMSEAAGDPMQKGLGLAMEKLGAKALLSTYSKKWLPSSIAAALDRMKYATKPLARLAKVGNLNGVSGEYMEEWLNEFGNAIFNLNPEDEGKPLSERLYKAVSFPWRDPAMTAGMLGAFAIAPGAYRVKALIQGRPTEEIAKENYDAVKPLFRGVMTKKEWDVVLDRILTRVEAESDQAKRGTLLDRALTTLGIVKPSHIKQAKGTMGWLYETQFGGDRMGSYRQLLDKVQAITNRATKKQVLSEVLEKSASFRVLTSLQDTHTKKQVFSDEEAVEILREMMAADAVYVSRNREDGGVFEDVPGVGRMETTRFFTTPEKMKKYIEDRRTALKEKFETENPLPANATPEQLAERDLKMREAVNAGVAKAEAVKIRHVETTAVTDRNAAIAGEERLATITKEQALADPKKAAIRVARAMGRVTGKDEPRVAEDMVEDFLASDELDNLIVTPSLMTDYDNQDRLATRARIYGHQRGREMLISPNVGIDARYDAIHEMVHAQLTKGRTQAATEAQPELQGVLSTVLQITPEKAEDKDWFEGSVGTRAAVSKYLDVTKDADGKAKYHPRFEEFATYLATFSMGFVPRARLEGPRPPTELVDASIAWRAAEKAGVANDVRRVLRKYLGEKFFDARSRPSVEGDVTDTTGVGGAAAARTSSAEATLARIKEAFLPDRVVFDDPTHTYKIDGQVFESVHSRMDKSKVVGFDTAAKAAAESQKTGETVEQVLDRWDGVADEGNRLHDLLEAYLLEGTVPEGNAWVKTLGDILREEGLAMPETIVWRKPVAGTVDVIVVRPDGRVRIYDLKTGGDSKGKRAAWAVQLSAYRAMIEAVGVQVESTTAVVVGAKDNSLNRVLLADVRGEDYFRDIFPELATPVSDKATPPATSEPAKAPKEPAEDLAISKAKVAAAKKQVADRKAAQKVERTKKAAELLAKRAEEKAKKYSELSREGQREFIQKTVDMFMAKPAPSKPEASPAKKAEAPASKADQIKEAFNLAPRADDVERVLEKLTADPTDAIDIENAPVATRAAPAGMFEGLFGAAPQAAEGEPNAYSLSENLYPDGSANTLESPHYVHSHDSQSYASVKSLRGFFRDSEGRTLAMEEYFTRSRRMAELPQFEAALKTPDAWEKFLDDAIKGELEGLPDSKVADIGSTAMFLRLNKVTSGLAVSLAHAARMEITPVRRALHTSEGWATNLKLRSPTVAYWTAKTSRNIDRMISKQGVTGLNSSTDGVDAFLGKGDDTGIAGAMMQIGGKEFSRERVIDALVRLTGLDRDLFEKVAGKVVKGPDGKPVVDESEGKLVQWVRAFADGLRDIKYDWGQLKKYTWEREGSLAPLAPIAYPWLQIRLKQLLIGDIPIVRAMYKRNLSEETVAKIREMEAEKGVPLLEGARRWRETPYSFLHNLYFYTQSELAEPLDGRDAEGKRVTSVAQPTDFVERIREYGKRIGRALNLHRIVAYESANKITRARNPAYMTRSDMLAMHQELFDKEDNLPTYEGWIGPMGEKTDNYYIDMIRYLSVDEKFNQALAEYTKVYESIPPTTKDGKPYRDTILRPPAAVVALAKAGEWFEVSHLLNIAPLLPALFGNLAQYKDKADLLKRAAVTASPGLIPQLGVQGGLDEDTRVVVVELPEGLEAPDTPAGRYEKVESLDGYGITLGTWDARLVKSVGDIAAKGNSRAWVIKPVVSGVNVEGLRTLFKLSLGHESLMSPNSMPEAIIKFIKGRLGKDAPDIIVFRSGAKQTGGRKVVKITPVRQKGGAWVVPADTALTPDDVSVTKSKEWRWQHNPQADLEAHNNPVGKQLLYSLSEFAAVFASLNDIQREQVEASLGKLGGTFEKVARVLIKPDSERYETNDRIKRFLAGSMPASEVLTASDIADLQKDIAYQVVDLTRLQAQMLHHVNTPGAAADLTHTHRGRIVDGWFVADPTGDMVRVSRARANIAEICLPGEVTKGKRNFETGKRKAGAVLDKDAHAKPTAVEAILETAWVLAKNNLRADLFKPDIHGLLGTSRDAVVELLKDTEMSSEDKLTALQMYFLSQELDMETTADGKFFANVPGELILFQRVPTDGPHSSGVARVIGEVGTGEASAVVLPTADVIRTGSDFDIDAFYVIPFSGTKWDDSDLGRSNRVLSLVASIMYNAENLERFYEKVDPKRYSGEGGAVAQGREEQMALSLREPFATPKGQLATREVFLSGPARGVGIAAASSRAMAVLASAGVRSRVSWVNRLLEGDEDEEDLENPLVPPDKAMALNELNGTTINLSVDNTKEQALAPLGVSHDTMNIRMLLEFVLAKEVNTSKGALLPSILDLNAKIASIMKSRGMLLYGTHIRRRDSMLWRSKRAQRAYTKGFAEGGKTPDKRRGMSTKASPAEQEAYNDGLEMRENIQKAPHGETAVELYRAANELRSLSEFVNLQFTPMTSSLLFDKLYQVYRQIEANDFRYFDVSSFRDATGKWQPPFQAAAAAMDFYAKALFNTPTPVRSALARDVVFFDLLQKAPEYDEDSGMYVGMAPIRGGSGAGRVGRMGYNEAAEYERAIRQVAQAQAVARKFYETPGPTKPGEKFVLTLSGVVSGLKNTLTLKPAGKWNRHHMLLNNALEVYTYPETVGEHEVMREGIRLAKHYQNLAPDSPEAKRLQAALAGVKGFVSVAPGVNMPFIDALMFVQASLFGPDSGAWTGSMAGVFPEKYLLDLEPWVAAETADWSKQRLVGARYDTIVKSWSFPVPLSEFVAQFRNFVTGYSNTWHHVGRAGYDATDAGRDALKRETDLAKSRDRALEAEVEKSRKANEAFLAEQKLKAAPVVQVTPGYLQWREDFLRSKSTPVSMGRDLGPFQKMLSATPGAILSAAATLRATDSFLETQAAIDAMALTLFAREKGLSEASLAKEWLTEMSKVGEKINASVAAERVLRKHGWVPPSVAREKNWEAEAQGIGNTNRGVSVARPTSGIEEIELSQVPLTDYQPDVEQPPEGRVPIVGGNEDGAWLWTDGYIYWAETRVTPDGDVEDKYFRAASDQGAAPVGVSAAPATPSPAKATPQQGAGKAQAAQERGVAPFKFQVKPGVPAKEQAKMNAPGLNGETLAGVIITEKAPGGSSSGAYLAQARGKLATTADEVVAAAKPGALFIVSVPGAGRGVDIVADEGLDTPYSRILEVLEAGGTVRTDTSKNAHSSFNAGGEGQVFDYLATLEGEGTINGTDSPDGKFREWRKATPAEGTGAPAYSLSGGSETAPATLTEEQRDKARATAKSMGFDTLPGSDATPTTPWREVAKLAIEHFDRTKAAAAAEFLRRVLSAPGFESPSVYFAGNEDYIQSDDGGGPYLAEATSTYQTYALATFINGPHAAYLTFLHETVHTVTNLSIHNVPELAARLTALREEAIRLAETSGKIRKDSYGFRNNAEFIAEAFSRPYFQQFLASIPRDATGGKPVPSIWDRFLELLRDAVARFTRSSSSSDLSMLEEVIREALAMTDSLEVPTSSDYWDETLPPAFSLGGDTDMGIVLESLRGVAKSHQDLMRMENFYQTFLRKAADKAASYRKRMGGETVWTWPGGTERTKVADEALLALQFLLDSNEKPWEMTDKELKESGLEAFTEVEEEWDTPPDPATGFKGKRHREMREVTRDSDGKTFRIATPTWKPKDPKPVWEIFEKYNALRKKNPRLLDWRAAAKEMRADFQAMRAEANKELGSYASELERLIPYRLAYAPHLWKHHPRKKPELPNREETMERMRFQGLPTDPGAVDAIFNIEMQEYRKDLAEFEETSGGKSPEEVTRALSRKLGSFSEAAKWGYVSNWAGADKLVDAYARTLGMVVRNKVMLNTMAASRGPDNVPPIIFLRDRSLKGTPSVLGDSSAFDLLRSLILMQQTHNDPHYKFEVDLALDPWDQIQEVVSEIGVTDLKRLGFRKLAIPSGRLNFTEIWALEGVPEKIGLHLLSRGYEDWGEYGQFAGKVGRALKFINNVWNSFSKTIQLGVSLFHHFAQFESYVAAMGFRAGVKDILFFGLARDKRKFMLEHPEMVNDWQMHGLTLPRETPDFDAGPFDTFLRKGAEWAAKHEKKWGKATYAVSLPFNTLRYAKKLNDHLLWQFLQPIMKVTVAENILGRARLMPGVGDRDEAGLKRDIANLVNDMFGGQNWTEYLWATPAARDLMRTFLFAPDWTISAINTARLGEIIESANIAGIPLGFSTGLAKATSTGVPAHFLKHTYWPLFIGVVLLGLPNLLQFLVYLLSKKLKDKDGKPLDPDIQPFTLMNEVDRTMHIDITPIMRALGFEFPPTGVRRVYMQFGKQAYELVRWFTQPRTSYLSKSSAVVKTTIEQVLGKNSAWWDMPWVGSNEDSPDFMNLFSSEGSFMKGRMGAMVRQFIPMSILSWVDDRPTTFFAPSSLGASKTGSQRRMMAALALYAEEDLWGKVRGIPGKVKQLDELFPDEIDALIKNGYGPRKNALTIMNQAAGKVAAAYNIEIFRELNREGGPRDEVLEVYLRRLHRLRRKFSQIKGSEKLRLEQDKTITRPERQAAYAKLREMYTKTKSPAP